MLVLYDAILFAGVTIFFLWFQHGGRNDHVSLTWPQILAHTGLSLAVIIPCVQDINHSRFVLV